MKAFDTKGMLRESVGVCFRLHTQETELIYVRLASLLS